MIRRHPKASRLAGRALLLAPVLCIAALAGAFVPLLDASRTTALACGLQDTPTMMAKPLGGGPAIAALLQPVTRNTPEDAPIGAFATDFIANQPIGFYEDLSNVVGLTPDIHITWQWSFGDGATANQDTPAHTYAAPGDYKVTATPIINGQPDQPDSAAIHIVASLPARPPVIVARSTATVTDGNTAVSFDASGSHAADGSPLTYYWNFADGKTSTSPRETHTFPPLLGQGATSAKSVVALIVTDSHGARSVAYLNIEIVTEIPKANVVASALSVTSGDTVSFDASASTPPQNPPNDVLAGYTWNFGDGSPQITTQAPTVSHTFRREGTFTVTVQAIDQQGYPGIATVSVSVAHNWTPLVLGIIAALAAAVGGFFVVRAQRRRNALIRRSVAAMELARARAASPRSRERAGVPARSRPNGPQRAGPAGPRPPGGPPRPQRTGANSDRDTR